MSIRIDLATPADDAELLDFMKTTTLPGADFTLAMQREPSLFAAGPAMGHVHQVVVSRLDGHLIGMAERAERRLCVNGEPATVGYLSGVRVHPAHRGGPSLVKGFRTFRELHGRGAAALYLTTIASGNEAARAVLSSGRAGLPAYHHVAPYVTAAIPVRRAVRAVPLEGGSVAPAAAGELDELLAFWRAVGARRQLFPWIEREDLLGEGGRLAGMHIEDVLVARRRGRIVGTLARWDQHRYKQWQLVSYGWKMRAARPAYHLLALAFGWPRMPDPGSRIASVYGALAALEGDDRAVWRSLLTALVAGERARGGAFVAVGMMEGDPLLAEALALKAFVLMAELYLVTFDEAGERARQALDGRPFYVELATL